MSKRLKRRIHELCGLINLNRDEKIRKANEILNSSELKQSICNQILGTSFKDVERAMTAILKERQLTESQQEMLELEEEVPEKFDPDFEFAINKHASDRHQKSSNYGHPTREQVAAWLAASERKDPTPSYPTERFDYVPMDRETAERLVREHYEYKEREKKRKEEQWALQKTIESVAKTVSTTKRSKSTKASK